MLNNDVERRKAQVRRLASLLRASLWALQCGNGSSTEEAEALWRELYSSLGALGKLYGKQRFYEPDAMYYFATLLPMIRRQHGIADQRLIPSAVAEFATIGEPIRQAKEWIKARGDWHEQAVQAARAVHDELTTRRALLTSLAINATRSPKVEQELRALRGKLARAATEIEATRSSVMSFDLAAKAVAIDRLLNEQPIAPPEEFVRHLPTAYRLVREAENSARRAASAHGVVTARNKASGAAAA